MKHRSNKVRRNYMMVIMAYVIVIVIAVVVVWRHT